MNGDEKYAREIKEELDNIDFDRSIQISKNFHIVICPPIVFANVFSESKAHNENGDFYTLGAQNCASEVHGSYTGEISAKMLREVGVKYAILGHSERRKHFGESEDIILKKMERAIENSLVPIVCVYSFKEDRQYITNIVNDFCNNKLSKKLVIAYEPEFSIGSGVSDSLDSIESNITQIKALFSNRNIENKEIYVVYGGSVNAENFLNIMTVCDGVLIGKTSLDINSFRVMTEKISS